MKTAEEVLDSVIEKDYKDVPKVYKTDFQMSWECPARSTAVKAMEEFADQLKPKWVSVDSQTWSHGETYLTFSPEEGRRYLPYGTQRNGFPHGVTHVLPNEYIPNNPLPTKP